VLYCVKRSYISVAWLNYSLRHIGRTHNLTLQWIFETCGNGSFAQIHHCCFSHNTKNASYHYYQHSLSRFITCQRCLRSTLQSHSEKRVNYRNLKCTFEESLPCYWYAELGSSELLYRANFPGSIAIAPLFFEKNNGCGSEISPFYRYRYSLLWRESWPKEKFARTLPSAHVDSNCSSHRFALILDDFFAVSQQ